MPVIAHAGHPDHFLAGFVVGVLLSTAYLLLRFMSRRT